MEPKPLVIVTSSKQLSKRKAIKAIDSFLETHESSSSDQSNSLQSRDRVGAVPEDVIIKLKIMRSFMGSDRDTVLSSSSVKADQAKTEFLETPGKRTKKKTYTEMNGNSATKLETEPLLKQESEEMQVSKKSRKSTDSNINLSEKKKKSRKLPA